MVNKRFLTLMKLDKNIEKEWDQKISQVKEK